MTTGSGALVRSPIMSCGKAGKFNIEHWLGFLDLGPHIGDHLLAAALSVALQLDRNVARIGLGNGRETELQTGAARSIFHLRRGAENSLHVRIRGSFLRATNQPA